MKFDAIIIGAGITGISIAMHATKAGLKCAIVDPLVSGDQAQASFGNAGILARNAILPIVTKSTLASLPYYLTSSDSPASFRYRYALSWLPWTLRAARHARQSEMLRIAAAQDALLFDSLDQHFALAQGTAAETLIQQSDLTYIYKTKAQAEADNKEAWIKKKFNIHAEWLDRAALQSKDPALSETFQYGLCYSDHGWISDPAKYLEILSDHLKHLGCVFIQKRALRIEAEGIILDTGEIVRSEKTVLAAGAASANLLHHLGIRIPLLAERGYHIHVPDCPIKPPSPYLVEGKFGMTPMSTGLRIAGTTELSHVDAPVQMRRFTYLKDAALGLYPALDFTNATSWVGHRPSLPDSLPCLGILPDHDHILCAFGAQHLGLTMGPKTGNIITQILTETAPNIDLTPFSPSRFIRH